MKITKMGPSSRICTVPFFSQHPRYALVLQFAIYNYARIKLLFITRAMVTTTQPQINN